MTTEEKAKAYDEALEKAKEIKGKILQSHLSTESCKAISEYIDTIIPELCESDDERIRKAIIYNLNNLNVIYNATKEECLAWLEKQKEQKSTTIPERIRPKFSVGDTVCRKGYADHTIIEIYLWKDPVYICKNDEGLESHIPFSKQDMWEKKEQKPLEHLSVMDDFDLDGNPKQKSTKWSDVDEMHRSGIVRNLKFLKDRGDCSDLVKDTLQRRINWLESLHPQSKQEWGEEDDGVLGQIITAFHRIANGNEHYFSQDTAKVFEEKLKSLRPQSKQEWSEEDEANFKWFDKFFRAESVITDGRDIPQDKYLWFKSLRPQPKKEWSKKDKKILQSLHHVMNCADVQNAVKRDGLNIADVCDFLFSVEPNWKPSEEQMKHLERCFSHGHTSQLPNQHILESLYNDLKKLKED